MQHRDTLQQLHAELEHLKMENKGLVKQLLIMLSFMLLYLYTELNFRLVMCRCGQISCKDPITNYL